jgi:hypothetical protein
MRWRSSTPEDGGLAGVWALATAKLNSGADADVAMVNSRPTMKGQLEKRLWLLGMFA